MKNFVLAALVLGLIATFADAGPFRRYSRSGNTYQNNGNQARFPVANAFLGSAAGVASYLASIGRIGHYGGNPYAYEGVGMGSSPQAALNNCCNNGGVVADSGVCQGSNGMWYACKRYHGR